jgi:hypothetical protein
MSNHRFTVKCEECDEIFTANASETMESNAKRADFHHTKDGYLCHKCWQESATESDGCTIEIRIFTNNTILCYTECDLFFLDSNSAPKC